jgi:hypothetical protein
MHEFVPLNPLCAACRYEDYLDNQITATDMFYLEDVELARHLVELGCVVTPVCDQVSQPSSLVQSPKYRSHKSNTALWVDISKHLERKNVERATRNAVGCSTLRGHLQV